jgi:hypothetical protein
MAISIPFSFSPNTTALSAQVNSNFSALGNSAVNVNGDTMAGTLNTLSLIPTVTNTSDLGSSSLKYRNTYTVGLITTTITANGITYTFPASQTANYFLQTDGAGTLSWQPATQVLEVQVMS